MELFISTLEYILTHRVEFAAKVATHLTLSVNAILLALALAFPLGMLTARSRFMAPVVTNIIGAVRSVPSLAVMALMLPFIGIGYAPALVALCILAFPPILLNTQAGFQTVSPAVMEAARGMGLSRPQMLWQIELPLALPVVIAGFRTAAVEVLASATLGAIIGAGGLGEYIFSGLSLGRSYTHLMAAGAVPIALLALFADTILYRMERFALHRAAGERVPAGGGSRKAA